MVMFEPVSVMFEPVSSCLNQFRTVSTFVLRGLRGFSATSALVDVTLLHEKAVEEGRGREKCENLPPPLDFFFLHSEEILL